MLKKNQALTPGKRPSSSTRILPDCHPECSNTGFPQRAAPFVDNEKKKSPSILKKTIVKKGRVGPTLCPGGGNPKSAFGSH